MFKHLLVPVDGSEHAGRAIDIAGDLAQRYGAKVTLFHAMTQVGGYQVPKELTDFERIEHMRVTEHDLIESIGQEILAKAEKRARDHGVKDCATLLETGDPARLIAEAVQSKGHGAARPRRPRRPAARQRDPQGLAGGRLLLPDGEVGRGSLP
jgi:nucleotide-binding universal stress UspA family protein